MRRSVLVNAVGFQAGWFACVLGAAHGRVAIGSAVAAALLALHVAFSDDRRAELRLIAAAVGVGAVWDSTLSAIGWVVYREGEWLAGAAPGWILLLWALFAATLRHSMRWLQGQWLLAALFGAVGGPLSFLAGVRLGAAELPDPQVALVALALGWTVWVPLLVALAARPVGTQVRHA